MENNDCNISHDYILGSTYLMISRHLTTIKSLFAYSFMALTKTLLDHKHSQNCIDENGRHFIYPNLPETLTVSL